MHSVIIITQRVSKYIYIYSTYVNQQSLVNKLNIYRDTESEY